jgi:hypothetical protein
MPDQYRLRREALEWRQVEGEVVAADMRQSVYLSVNRAGTVLWPALSEGATQEQLVARLVEACEVDHDVAARDVACFLEALRDHGLLDTYA